MGRSRKGEEAYRVQQSLVSILCSVSSFCWAGEHYGHGQCDAMTLPKPKCYINMARLGAAKGEEAWGKGGVIQRRKILLHGEECH